MMPPRWRRLICWALGHRWVHVDAQPVTAFDACTRCGKYERLAQERR